MTCSVCGKEFGSGSRFCRKCANDSADPIKQDAPGISDLRRAYQTLSASPIEWNAVEAALLAALPYHGAGQWPNALLLRARIEYAFLVLRRAGCEPSELPASELELFAERLDGLDWHYDNLLTDEVRGELERGSGGYGYEKLIRGHISLCEKILSLREAGGTNATPRPVSEGAQRVTSGKPTSRIARPVEGEPNGDSYMLAYPRGAERLEVASIGIRCVKCPNHVIPLSPCSNCGGVAFMLSTDVLNNTGLVCYLCRSSITSVKCACGCQNPIQGHTIMRLKAKSSGCFIATAACGDPWAPEVLVLSGFRDDILVRSRIGRACIHVYYAISPPIAAAIARSSALRCAAMAVLVRPVVRFVSRVNRNRVVAPKSQAMKQ
jgi:hypothetical protein